MDVIEVPDLLNKTLKTKNCTLSLNDYRIAITIFKAAPNFNLLNKFVHLELKKQQGKTDTYTIRMDKHNNTLTFKKMSEDSVSIISINLK